MKQILVISGKGGTGKTMLASSFAVLDEKKVIADCDVDAADMHLVLAPKIIEEKDFKGGKKAFIDTGACISCKRCRAECVFEAISENYEVDEYLCEGCGLCARICPANAVTLKNTDAGKWFVSATKYGKLIHAELKPGADNSGKLVTLIRKEAEKTAAEEKADYIIIDGPPGTGCPVMASLTGVDTAVVITEPSVSGVHDFKRLMQVIKNFKIKAGLVINKYDINPEKTEELEKEALKNGVQIFGKISFDLMVNDSIIQGTAPVVGASESTKKEIKNIWNIIREI